MPNSAPRWVSYIAASRILQVSPSTVRNMVLRGELKHRNGPRWIPSIHRGSAEELAYRRREDAAAIEKARHERELLKKPPQDGQVWLNVSTTAALLGVTPTRVTQMIRREQMPATRVGHRWWILRQHAEIIAAARSHHRLG